MARKIIQVAAMPIGLLKEKNGHAITEQYVRASTIALCDDGTLWAMNHTLEGETPPTWVQYAPIPQY